MQLDTITCADCFDLMATLEDASIDFIFTDPPYGHNNNNGDLIHRREVALGQSKHALESRPIANDGQEANEIFRAILPEFKRVLKPGACCCCCCCCGGGPDPQFARWALWMDEVLQFKQMVVWDKGPMGMGWHYRRSYETVLVAQRQGAACRWFDTSLKIENIIRPGMGIAKIIPSQDQHPTQKPIELAEWFIQLHTQPGDVVLDPFAGSGTTALACMKTGRHYICGDSDPDYVTIAQRRVQTADPFVASPVSETEVQLSLFEERNE